MWKLAVRCDRFVPLSKVQSDGGYFTVFHLDVERPIFQFHTSSPSLGESSCHYENELLLLLQTFKYGVSDVAFCY